MLTSDTVNGINPVSWMIFENEERTTISGRKIFRGDMHIGGNCYISNEINGINPTVLNDRVLKIFGDQEIRGNVAISNLTSRR